MKRKTKISQKEKNRRDKQRHKQWEKDNPVEAHMIKEFSRRPMDYFHVGMGGSLY